MTINKKNSQRFKNKREGMSHLNTNCLTKGNKSIQSSTFYLRKARLARKSFIIEKKRIIINEI